MWISRYFVYFTVFSVMGYIYECCFCTIVKGKWENRGFLYGPVVPIYGVGGAALVGVCEIINIYIGNYTWWQVFLIGYFGSIVLEYSTSWALEKLFHAYWWDYSDMPFNIKGRICLPYSLCFGGAALLVNYVIAPATLRVTNHIPAIIMELLSLIFMAILAGDTALTVSALTGFERNIIALENSVNAHMDALVENIQEKKQEAAEFFAEERERFSRESIERNVALMSGLHKSAITRVKGFRNTKVQRHSLEHMIEAIKKRVPKSIKKK